MNVHCVHVHGLYTCIWYIVSAQMCVYAYNISSNTAFLSLQAAFVIIFEDSEPSMEVIVSE